MGILEPLLSAVGTAAFQRTFLLEKTTDNGVPRLLIVFDAILEEEPRYEAQVTEHPVEEGPEITDHINLKNPSLRLKGTISNTPIDLATSIGNLLSTGLSLISDNQFRKNVLNSGIQSVVGAIGAKVLYGGTLNAGSLLQGASDSLSRQILLRAYERKARFDVITKRTKYPGMVIESMTFPRNADTGGQLMFELELKHIRVVSPQVIQVGTTSDDVVNSATDISKLGNQAPSPLDTSTLAQAESAQSATGFNGTLSEFKLGA